MKKSIASLVLLFSILNIANANPFDILHNNNPDFVVSDIWQDASSKDIFVKVCNTWSDMGTSGTMTVWVSINWGGIISNVIQGVNMNSWICWSYDVASVNELPTVWNWYYIINGAVLMDASINEKTKWNNTLKKNIYINILNNATTQYINGAPYYNNNTPNPYLNGPIYNNNANNRVRLPDLIVDSIVQGPNRSTLNVKVCNRWYAMNVYQNFFTWIYNGVFNVAKNTNVMLGKWECTLISLNTWEISIYLRWSYNLIARTDIYNSVVESNENNNSLTKNVYLR